MSKYTTDWGGGFLVGSLFGGLFAIIVGLVVYLKIDQAPKQVIMPFESGEVHRGDTLTIKIAIK